MSITKTLLLLNLFVFIIEVTLGDRFIDRFALWPVQSAHFHPYQFITYAFLHAGLLHLGVNMLSLWMFGSSVETAVGPTRFLSLYLTAALVGAFTQLLVFSISGVTSSPIVGASAGIFGLLVAYAVYFPKEKVIFLLLPVPMPAWLFVVLYAGVELYLGLTGLIPGVGHWAHLGGALGALVLLMVWRFGV